MKNIKLPKIENVEIEVLQMELVNFITHKNGSLRNITNTNDYCSQLLFLDIAQKMAYTFRNKIEKSDKAFSTLSCSVAEAVVLLQCCSDTSTLRNDYEHFVMTKFIGLIHQELINLI